jgi:hypothetical protein
LLRQLGPPYNNEEARFKRKAANKIPKGRKPQVLHILSPNRQLEVNGKEEKVPDQVHPDRKER